jgi:5-methylcytosine-specific restriction protein A
MSDLSPEIFYSPSDQVHLKRERAKAKELKSSQWWKQKLAHGVCYYCENKFQKPDLTMDHILAIGRGGMSTKGNIVVCCRACNSKKAHKTPAEIALESL